MFQVILGGFCLIVLIVVFIDITPIFQTWLSRIHIGRWKDKQLWNNAISKTSIKWLNHTPKIKVTDNTRLIALDMIKGNYTKSAIQHWQEAALLLGLSEYLKNKEDKDVKNEINRFLKRKITEDGHWKEKPQYVDGAILAYAVMKVPYIDIDEYKAALDETYELIKEHLGEDGTVQYRQSMPMYRYVDTIGFICPFLTTYGLRYEKEECIELAINQLRAYNEYGIHEKYEIPCHVYNSKTKEPLGLYGWGRGLGWYAIGLIDSWNELPKNNNYKFELEEMVITYAKNIMNYQQKDGSWRWTVTRGETRADASTTATLGWFLLNASQIDSISNACLMSVEKAQTYLMSVTRKNGIVDFSQGDTKDIGVYAMLFDKLPFTQGFTLRTLHKYLNHTGK